MTASEIFAMVEREVDVIWPGLPYGLFPSKEDLAGAIAESFIREYVGVLNRYVWGWAVREGMALLLPPGAALPPPYDRPPA